MLGLVYLFSVGTGTDLAGAGVVLDHDDEQTRLAVDAGLVDERGDVVLAAGLDRRPIAAARLAGIALDLVDEQAGHAVDAGLVDEQVDLDLAAGLDRHTVISDNSKFVSCGVTGVRNVLLGQNSTSSNRLETTTILIYSTDIIKQCGIYFWPQLAQVPFLPFKDFSRDNSLSESCQQIYY